MTDVFGAYDHVGERAVAMEFAARDAHYLPVVTQVKPALFAVVALVAEHS